MALLRYIIEIPTQLTYRIHLRNQMMSSGLHQVFTKLKSWPELEFKDVMIHVESFESRAVADQDEFIEGIDNGITFLDADLEDPSAILEVLLRSFASNSTAVGYLKSILLHLLIPTKLSNEIIWFVVVVLLL
jgi:hypothetical protein